jgi:hypothetical protein
MEMAGGVFALATAALTWSGQRWSWVLASAGLLLLSPWPGPAAILRRAETHPEVLESDAERGPRRSGRLGLPAVRSAR